MPQLCPGQRPPFLSVTSRVRIPAAQGIFFSFPGNAGLAEFIPPPCKAIHAPNHNVAAQLRAHLIFTSFFSCYTFLSASRLANRGVFSSFINDDTCTALLPKRSNCRASRFASRRVASRFFLFFFASKGIGVRITSAIWQTLFVPLSLYHIGVRITSAGRRYLYPPSFILLLYTWGMNDGVQISLADTTSLAEQGNAYAWPVKEILLTL